MLTIQNIISYFKKNPNHLFLADALGALNSSVLAGIVLVKFNDWIGMPIDILYGLSILASIFCIYSFLCFLFIKKNWSPFILIIAIANTIYCCLTLLLMVYYFDSLKSIAKLFFPFEMLVVLLVVYIEVKVINEFKK